MMMFLHLSLLLSLLRSLVAPSPQLRGVEASDYSFAEEFEGSSLDMDTWAFNYGDGSQYGNWGWGNGEQQWYVDHPEVVYVHDGKLNIDLVPGSRVGMPDKRLVAGKIVSKGKFSFKYGRVDARIRLKSAVDGLFPAVWMMPESSVYGRWPKSGEIDIYEFSTSFGKGSLPQGLHFQARHGGNSLSFASAARDATEWGVYSLIWTETQITFLWNGIVSGSYTRPQQYSSYDWPYDQEFYFICNFAAEPGFSKPLPRDFQGSGMEIDYIRVLPAGFCPNSQVTQSAVTDCHDGWKWVLNHDVLGHDFAEREESGSFFGCPRKCDGMADCKGFAWAPGYCYFKTGDISKCDITQSANVHLGLKC